MFLIIKYIHSVACPFRNSLFIYASNGLFEHPQVVCDMTLKVNIDLLTTKLIALLSLSQGAFDGRFVISSIVYRASQEVPLIDRITLPGRM